MKRWVWAMAGGATAAAAATAVASAIRLRAAARSVPLVHTSNVRAVYQVHGDRWKDGVGLGLHYVQKLLGTYDQLGVAPNERHLVVVLHGAAGYWLLKDAAWAAYAGQRDDRSATNPNAALVAALLRDGVRVEMCANTMKDHGWERGDLLDGVHVVPSAYPRVIDLQLQGYAHLLFD